MKVIIAGSSVGELALHYLNRMNIAVLKVLSKFDLRLSRLCLNSRKRPIDMRRAVKPSRAVHYLFTTLESGENESK